MRKGVCVGMREAGVGGHEQAQYGWERARAVCGGRRLVCVCVRVCVCVCVHARTTGRAPLDVGLSSAQGCAHVPTGPCARRQCARAHQALKGACYLVPTSPAACRYARAQGHRGTEAACSRALTLPLRAHALRGCLQAQPEDAPEVPQGVEQVSWCACAHAPSAHRRAPCCEICIALLSAQTGSARVHRPHPQWSACSHCLPHAAPPSSPSPPLSRQQHAALPLTGWHAGRSRRQHPQ